MELRPDHLPFPIAYISAVLHAIARMLDAGIYDNVTLAQIQQHASAGTLWDFLKVGTEGLHILKFFDMRPDFTAWYVEQVRLRCSTGGGMERQGYIANTRGLCILLAITADILQDSPQLGILYGSGQALEEIFIEGGLPDLECGTATAGDLTWQRGEDEPVAAFRDRCRHAAIEAGERFLVFGGLPGVV